MKRVFQRKAKSFPGSSSAPKALIDTSKRVKTDIHSRSKTSVAMLGLALSVGASGSLLTCQDDQAVAAEPRTPILPTLVDETSGEPVAVRSMPSAEVGGPLVPRAVVPSPAPEPLHHIVREGETLWKLAHQYQISPESLAATNHLTTDDVLQVGQSIKIPVDVAASLLQPPTHQPLPAIASSPKVGQNLAQLQVLDASDDATISARPTPPSGDLSQRSTMAIARPSSADNSGNDTQISQRSELEAQVSSPDSGEGEPGAIAPAPTVQPAPPPHSEFSVAATATLQPIPAVEEPGSSSTAADSHRIRPGETLASIARYHGISVDALAEANGIRNPNRIFAGRMLVVPAPEAESPVAIAPPTHPSIEVAAVSQTFSTALPITPAQASESTADSFPTPRAITAPTVPAADLDEAVSDSEIQDGASEATADSDAGVAQFRTPDPQTDSVDRQTSTTSAEPPSQSQVAALEQPDSTVSSPSRPSANPYLENLMNEIDALAEQYQASSDHSENTDGEVPTPAATVATVLSMPPDVQYLQSGNAVNPEFNRPAQIPEAETANTAELSEDPVQPAAVIPEPEQPPQAQPEQLVAVAPLGSENYVPLGQPVTGRMVSPELPPLPGPEPYLPNGGGRFNGYLWPARGVLTSGYGWRWGRMHRGIDIAAPVGTPIYAAAPGIIEFSGWNSGGYGNMVDIRHPDGSKTRYAHNSRNLVRVGQQVQQGQQIAEMGSTGYSTGPHVHFEVHLPERGTVNPIAYLPENR